jgi:D-aminoacyl-tRNA deacylase
MSAGILAAVGTAGNLAWLPGARCLLCHVATLLVASGFRPVFEIATATGDNVGMRAVVQRVSRAKVTVGDRVTGAIEAGLLVLLGAGQGDTATDLAYIVDKIANLRIFADAAGKMNRSVLDTGGGVLVVSQFTLYGDARQGRRPAFTGALEPAAARALYEQALVALRGAGIALVQAGEFAADMAVELSNDGPVTILLDSRKGF